MLILFLSSPIIGGLGSCSVLGKPNREYFSWHKQAVSCCYRKQKNVIICCKQAERRSLASCHQQLKASCLKLLQAGCKLSQASCQLSSAVK